jgi:hypothetical protein
MNKTSKMEEATGEDESQDVNKRNEDKGSTEANVAASGI